MTYNVFGGMLNLTQLDLLFHGNHVIILRYESKFEFRKQVCLRKMILLSIVIVTVNC